MLLYRAASRATIAPATFGRGACFAAAREDAESYLDNPGFGGSALFAFEVEAEYVLHLNNPHAFETLAEALWDELVEAGLADDCEEPLDLAGQWACRGLCTVFDLLENTSGLEEIIADAYDWVVYVEPPVGDRRPHEEYCTTWRYYGRTPMVGRLIR